MLGKLFVVAIIGAVVAVMFSGDQYFRLFPEGDTPGILEMMTNSVSRDRVESELKRYDDGQEKSDKSTQDKVGDMVDAYYNIATDFYEYGWGQSFHFAHTKKDEGHMESILRHETRLADELGLTPGMKVVDAGCGVGGPARGIANYSKAHVYGVTINKYQVERGQQHTKKKGLSDLVTHIQGDFTKLPFEAESMDAAYAIEATCHAQKLEDVYGDIYRVLKPGGRFAVYEWLVTPKHDPNNEEHKAIAKEVEYGNGLPPLRSMEDVRKAADNVGFKTLKDDDLALDTVNTRPWYHRLDMGTFSHYSTHYFTGFMEMIGFAPKGSLGIHGVLLRAADGLVRGGKAGTFTPMHLVVMEKPKAAAKK